MLRKKQAVVVVLAMFACCLLITVGTRAEDDPAAKTILPDAESLPTLEVTIKSLSGGNFSSYSMPKVGTVGTIDFKALSSITENGERITFKKLPHDPEAFEDWYIPMPGSLRVDEASSRFGRQQVRLVAEGIAGGRLRMELDYFDESPGEVRVWIVHEYKGFIDSVALGTAELDGPILKATASE